MTAQWHGGKGSQPRKNSNHKAYADNWEKIFGEKSAKPNSESDKPKQLPPKL